jgi:hypothetical protein
MVVKDLGRLEKVDLREFWITEAGDFYPLVSTRRQYLPAR